MALNIFRSSFQQVQRFYKNCDVLHILKSNRKKVTKKGRIKILHGVAPTRLRYYIAIKLFLPA